LLRRISGSLPIGNVRRASQDIWRSFLEAGLPRRIADITREPATTLLRAVIVPTTPSHQGHNLTTLGSTARHTSAARVARDPSLKIAGECREQCTSVTSKGMQEEESKQKVEKKRRQRDTTVCVKWMTCPGSKGVYRRANVPHQGIASAVQSVISHHVRATDKKPKLTRNCNMSIDALIIAASLYGA